MKQLPPLVFYLLTLLHLAAFGATQDWDGVIVTQSDFQALQAFKQELVDPQGFLKSWNDSGFGACSGGWEGIKCALGQVIVIQLPWRGLSGKLTDKIGQFQALRKLSLHDNAIGGSIPSTLGLIPTLRGLQLYNNGFSGSIPSSLANCRLLQSLDLGNNALVGEIPPNIASSPNLLLLNASFNRLNGTIPAKLFASKTLIVLALQSNNKLSGSLPSEIGSSSGLRIVDISNNSLTGGIPASFSNLSSLLTLKLAKNNLSGEIPNSLGDLKNLSSLDVSYNSLSGSVPSSLSNKFDSTSFVGNLQLCNFSGGPPCAVAEAPAPAAVPRRKRRHKLNLKEIILIAAGVLLLVLVLLCFILMCCLAKKKTEAKPKTIEKKEKKAPVVSETGEAGGKLVHFDGPIVYTADDLLCATAEIMGKSTYGTVYKATLEDGNQVAVKRLREKMTKNQTEFEAEVSVLGKIRHPNLLAVRAYYVGPKGEKFLVFDFMNRGSLATFLHARGPETKIEWPARIKIIKGVARGLMHLHVIENMTHGNLTSSNVLLDDETNAKIGDYGLTRLMKGTATTSVIATAGALGYRAPELSKVKKANNKTDVYSLGVIILELLTGKSPSEVMNGVDLPQMVASVVKEEWTNEVFDLELMRDAPLISDELLNTLKLALHCVDPTPSARPESHQIVQQLEEIRPELQQVEEAVGSSGAPREEEEDAPKEIASPSED